MNILKVKDGDGNWVSIPALKGAPTDEQVQDAVDDYLEDNPSSTGKFTNSAKRALITLLENVAYTTGNGREYLNLLETELFYSVVSISAVFTQGEAKIYDTDSLEDLRQYLVVSATFIDDSTATVSDYTLSGALAAGTSTITVSYGGKTTTFTVTVTGVVWLYKEGEEYSSLTGGWDVGVGFVVNGSKISASKSNDMLSMLLLEEARGSDGAAAHAISTHNSIDLTNYSTMEIVYEGYRTPDETGVAAYLRMYFPVSITTASTQDEAYGSDQANNRANVNYYNGAMDFSGVKRTRSIDIAKYEQVYLSLSLNCWGGADNGTYGKVYSICLK